VVRHTASANGHRVWKRQPEGGSIGFGGSPVMLHLYVADVDAVVGKATAAGTALTRPVQDQFYGDRSGTITDPFGHPWHIATHIEDVAPDEIDRRAATAMRGENA